jgi:hypothetical protein
MKKAASEHYFTVEVRPPEATSFQVQDLQMGSRYSFAVMAFNEMGESEYTSTTVQATTASKIIPRYDHITTLMSIYLLFGSRNGWIVPRCPVHSPPPLFSLQLPASRIQ